MAVDWQPLAGLIRGQRRFVLTTHVRPDGDGLGSMLALGDVLRDAGKEARLIIASSLPPRYAFLDPDGRIERFAPDLPATWPEVVIVLDTGTWNQLGDLATYIRDFAGPRVVVDHHLTQDDLGALRFVDPAAEATGRLVFDLVRALGAPLSAPAATNLFVALAMDTGWFRHDNTRAETFALAGELVRAGAEPKPLYERLFEQNSLPRLRLLGLVLDRLQLGLGGRVAYSDIRLGDYAASAAVPADSEDMVNFTRSVNGVEVGVLFMEQPKGGIKVSFRATGRVDVARIAERFGGGGHRAASGATVPGTLDDVRERVLAALADAL